MTTAAAAAAPAGTPVTKASNAAQKLSGDFDNFLTLLTKQLQYQDPLSPLDTNQFTQQLVSFSGVEQSIQQNKNLEQLISLFQADGLSKATGLIGREVSVDTAKAHITSDGGGGWAYDLAASAGTTTLSITDKNGRTVYKGDGETTVGTHRLRIAPGQLPAGDYTLKVDAKSASGADVATHVYLTGTVDSVEVADGSSKLNIANSLVDVSAVSRVAPAKAQ